MRTENEIREEYDRLIRELKLKNIELSELDSMTVEITDSPYKIICKTQYQLLKWILEE